MSSRTPSGPLSRRLRDRNPVSIPTPTPIPAASSSKPQLKKIIEPRIRHGCTEYLVSWVGRDKRSWLSADALKTLGCAKQLNEFKTSLLGLNSKTINNSLGQRVSAVEDSSANSKSKSRDNKKRKRVIQKPSTRRLPVCSGVSGFARNLDPLRILGATDAAGEIMFLMSWFGCEELDLVPAREANVKCPQVVINFYEGRMLPQHFLSEDENQQCGEGDNDSDGSEKEP